MNKPYKLLQNLTELLQIITNCFEIFSKKHDFQIRNQYIINIQLDELTN